MPATGWCHILNGFGGKVLHHDISPSWRHLVMIVYVTPETKTQVTNYMLVTVAFFKRPGKSKYWSALCVDNVAKLSWKVVVACLACRTVHTLSEPPERAAKLQGKWRGGKLLLLYAAPLQRKPLHRNKDGQRHLTLLPKAGLMRGVLFCWIST